VGDVRPVATERLRQSPDRRRLHGRAEKLSLRGGQPEFPTCPQIRVVEGDPKMPQSSWDRGVGRVSVQAWSVAEKREVFTYWCYRSRDR
jgi:hypothetical protein